MKELIIIRGPSGSGKTTAAWKQTTMHLFEADRFFYDKYRYYEFRHDLLKEAHAWCLGTLANTIFVDRPDKVVVSNTFITKWEMQPYLDLAQKMGYTVKVYKTAGPWNASELARRNEHNVPINVISRQISKFEPFDGEIELS